MRTDPDIPEKPSFTSPGTRRGMPAAGAVAPQEPPSKIGKKTRIKTSIQRIPIKCRKC